MNIKKYIQDSIDTKTQIVNSEEILDTITKVAEEIVNGYNNGKKVLTAGNGGSAGDAQHIAGELVSKFFFDRPALSAFSLATDTSILTAIGNDYGYEKSFSRQIQANGCKGDIFIGISTSGNSKNIIEALIEAKNKGLITVGFVGSNPCQMDALCDYIIKVPSKSTPTIQESHIMIGHIICALVEESIFSKEVV
jgi:D-sedoheptulose 7-phosphate isomerase